MAAFLFFVLACFVSTAIGAERRLPVYEIQALTVEDAEKIVARYRNRPLDLSGLLDVSPEVAEVLASHGSGRGANRIDLSGLKSLSPDSAEALSMHRGATLVLDGLSELTPEVAYWLAQKNGSLSLNGLKHLDAREAERFSRTSVRFLCLNGVSEITAEAAETLVKPGGPSALSLGGLRSIDQATAQALEKFGEHTRESFRNLFLNGIEQLDNASAESLAKIKSDLSLCGLASLPPDIAEALAKHRFTLRLDGLTDLSPEAAKAIADHTGTLYLNGMTELSPAVAANLGKFSGHQLFLEGLRELHPRVAAGLASGNGKRTLYLRGVKTISTQSAMELVKNKGTINLRGLTTVPPHALAILKTHRRIQLSGRFHR